MDSQLTTIVQRIRNNYKGFPFRRNIKNLTKDQLLTFNSILNSLGLRNRLPEIKQKKVTNEQLKDKIRNCSFFHGLRKNIDALPINKLISRACKISIKPQKESKRYEPDYSNIKK